MSYRQSSQQNSHGNRNYSTNPIAQNEQPTEVKKENGFMNIFGCFPSFSNNIKNTNEQTVKQPTKESRDHENNAINSEDKAKTRIFSDDSMSIIHRGGSISKNKDMGNQIHNQSNTESTEKYTVDSKVLELEKQIGVLEGELLKKKNENQNLKSELIELEKSRNISKSGSLFLEKDGLRGEIQKFSSELAQKTENLRNLTATHKMLLEENSQLMKEINTLSAQEDEFDKGIKEFTQMSRETENLRN